MDKNSNAFTVGFASLVCVILATLLAATYSGLKSTIDDNAAFDKRTNVLIAMGFHDKSDATKSRADLEKLYAERVEGKVVELVRKEVDVEVWSDSKSSTEKESRVVEVVETEHDLEELDRLVFAESKKPADERRDYRAVYRGTDDEGNNVWCIPISGYGLWSTLYGFLALEADLDTVRGITFYKHGETPGLGGEVDNPKWQAQWPGKRILDDQGAVLGVAVKKGQVDPKIAYEKAHMVDGFAGATITGNGVTKFVKADLENYEPYFAKHRQK